MALLDQLLSFVVAGVEIESGLALQSSQCRLIQ